MIQQGRRRRLAIIFFRSERSAGCTSDLSRFLNRLTLLRDFHVWSNVSAVLLKRRRIRRVGEALANRDGDVTPSPGLYDAGIPLMQDSGVRMHPAARVARLRTDGETISRSVLL